jgi:hypothetical protein
LRRKEICRPGVCRIVGAASFMHKITCDAIKFLHFLALQQICGLFFSLNFFYIFSYIYLIFLPEPAATFGSENRAHPR